MRKYKFRGHDGMDWIYGMTIDYDKETDTYYMLSDRGEWVMVGDVGQFIGVRDLNGKEVYEGDIIRSYNELGEAFVTLSIVAYDKRHAKFTGFDTGYGRYEEVIGNIYDNPELMESEVS